MSLQEVIDVVNNLSGEETELCKRRDYVVGKYFCAEETISLSNVNITVEGVGKVNLPLNKETVNQLLSVSTEAEFQPLTRSVYDRYLRNPKMIPESKLKVELDDQIFTEVLGKIAFQLKIDENYKLVPHLYNMLIYKRRLFREHRYMEQIDNSIATLVLVLPTFCKGGKLRVNHAKTDVLPFKWSPYLNAIKCVAFYSDCYHSYTRVQTENRVVLTYNIELKCPDPPIPIDVTIVNEPLNDAVAKYFNTNKRSKYLILCLTHYYSENSLKWYTLKGNDRFIAWAMLAVSKKQKLTPYLALADSHEIWKRLDRFRHGKKSIILYHWLDENNMPCDRPEQFDVDAFHDDACFDSFCFNYKPYKENQIGSGMEQWYRLLYIVLVKE